jgi:Fe-S oxidoreductase
MPFAARTVDPQKTQEEIRDFLKGGAEPSEAALFKVRSCMRCYGCLDAQCPIGVDSMLIAELAAREIERRGKKPRALPPCPEHETLARRGTTAGEYAKITTERAHGGAEVVFFPGCNVYKQPDKLLNALTIMDAIGIPYSFIPGLTYCCGSSRRETFGDPGWTQHSAEKLFGLAERLSVKTMVFWCPTCLSMLHSRIKTFYQPPYACASFSEYLAEHAGRLRFPAAAPRIVTYHEPCKNAYMGIDTDSARRALSAVPGTELVEMKHHGKDTMCCGCNAVRTMPELGDAVTEARLREAEETGADTLIDLCHNCHWIFMPAAKKLPGPPFSLRIENFSTYITDAMGQGRRDTLK